MYGVKYEDEMIKKTVLKRAFKTLPQSKGKEALEVAASVVNEHEGINFKEESAPLEIDFTSEQSDSYKRMLSQADYVGLLCLIEVLSNEGQNQLWDIHEKPLIKQGGKGRYTEQMISHMKVARELREETLSSIREHIQNGDRAGVNEIFDECSTYERDFYMLKLNGEEQSIVNTFAG